jgi:hypothetical protein
MLNEFIDMIKENTQNGEVLLDIKSQIFLIDQLILINEQLISIQTDLLKP